MLGEQLVSHRTLGPAALTALSVAIALTAGARASAQPLAVGPEFRVNSVTAGRQTYPSIASDNKGNFVVAWDTTRGSQLETEVEIAVQRFDRSGLRRGGEILVSPHGYGGKVAMDADGDFVVAWDGFPAYLQRFDRTGAAQGGAIDIESSGGGAVEMADDGSFVLAWATYGSADISARRFDRNGASIGDPIDVGASSEGWYPGIGMNAAGDFVVVWSQGYRTGLGGAYGRGIFGQLYDRAGHPISGAFQVSATTAEGHKRPAVAMGPDGSFVVTWSFSGRGDTGVIARRFDRAGAPVASVFHASTYTTFFQSSPDVAIGPDRSFVLVWVSSGQDGDGGGVFSQLFDREGTRVGPEFQVNNHTLGHQSEPSVALAPTGDLLVAWYGIRDDNADSDVFARRYRVDLSSGGDADGDGVNDFVDNCPTVPNTDQADAGSDRLGDACVAPDVVIHPTARLGANPVIGQGTVIAAGVAIGDDVTIGERVTVGNRARLGNRVTVADDTRIDTGATIGDAAVIGDGVAIGRNAVVGSRATIGPLVVLDIGARVGRGATVETGARVGRRAIVRPGAVVPAGTTVASGATFP